MKKNLMPGNEIFPTFAEVIRKQEETGKRQVSIPSETRRREQAKKRWLST